MIGDVVARLRGLEAKATPGPWETGEIQHFHDHTFHAVYTDVEPSVCAGLVPADADLIVAMRNELPALLDLADRITRVQAVLDEGGHEVHCIGVPCDCWKAKLEAVLAGDPR